MKMSWQRALCAKSWSVGSSRCDDRTAQRAVPTQISDSAEIAQASLGFRRSPIWRIRCASPKTRGVCWRFPNCGTTWRFASSATFSRSQPGWNRTAPSVGSKAEFNAKAQRCKAAKLIWQKPNGFGHGLRSPNGDSCLAAGNPKTFAPLHLCAFALKTSQGSNCFPA